MAPRLTHEWQKHDRELELTNARYQKELALKALLARNIGESTGSFLAVMHSTELSWRGRIGLDYDHAYQRWSAISNGIATQIGVYFPSTEIYESWLTYEDNIYDLYSLVKHKDPAYRQALLEQIAQYVVDSGLGKAELKVIAEFDALPDDVTPDVDAYSRRLLGGFKSRADKLISAVLGADSILTKPDERSFAAEGVETKLADGGEAGVDELRDTDPKNTSAAAMANGLHAR